MSILDELTGSLLSQIQDLDVAAKSKDKEAIDRAIKVSHAKANLGQVIVSSATLYLKVLENERTVVKNSKLIEIEHDDSES